MVWCIIISRVDIMVLYIVLWRIAFQVERSHPSIFIIFQCACSQTAFSHMVLCLFRMRTIGTVYAEKSSPTPQPVLCADNSATSVAKQSHPTPGPILDSLVVWRVSSVMVVRDPLRVVPANSTQLPHPVTRTAARQLWSVVISHKKVCSTVLLFCSYWLNSGKRLGNI